MEQYDTNATADPFARSVDAFERLTRTLSGGTAAALRAARRVASRSASGRMTTPLPSTWITRGMSLLHGSGIRAW